MVINKLSQFSVHPSRVASILKWNKSNSAIMAISVSKGSIGVAASKHPSNWDQMKNPISFSTEICARRKRGIGDQHVYTIEKFVNQMDNIVNKHNICAVLVDWPISRYGRCGASCGQTLFYLDAMLRSSDAISKNRPFTLVNYLRMASSDDLEDRWGRIVNFSGGFIDDHHMENGYRSKLGLSLLGDGSNARHAKESLIHFFNEYYGEEIDIQTKQKASHSTFDFVEG
jgi:hypothetical protein